MSNPIITGLTEYIVQNKSGLIAKSILSAKSARLLTLQTEVKGTTSLNLINTDVALQDGSDCGWSASGTTELSQRMLVPAYVKVNMPFCDKKLLGTFAQHQVKIAAGEKTLPFEEDFVNGIVEGVAEAVEKTIWQGDDSNAGEFDGLLTILEAASASTISVSGATGTPAYTAIKEVYMAMPEAVASKSDATIFVSAGVFRKFIQELVSANLYHYNPENNDEEYVLPGTSIKVVKVNGLNGTATYDYIVGARLSNLFYGVDGIDDASKIDGWYSKDNREFRFAVEFAGATQVAYPDEVVVGKFTK